MDHKPTPVAVYSDGTVCGEGCTAKHSGLPEYFLIKITWEHAVALEMILSGDIDLELIDKREDILDDVKKVLVRSLKNTGSTSGPPV